VTISNQVTSSLTDSPVPVDGRKLRNPRLVSPWRARRERLRDLRREDPRGHPMPAPERMGHTDAPPPVGPVAEARHLVLALGAEWRDWVGVQLEP
jgi:hypothetical protein